MITVAVRGKLAFSVQTPRAFHCELQLERKTRENTRHDLSRPSRRVNSRCSRAPRFAVSLAEARARENERAGGSHFRIRARRSAGLYFGVATAFRTSAIVAGKSKPYRRRKRSRETRLHRRLLIRSSRDHRFVACFFIMRSPMNWCRY